MAAGVPVFASDSTAVGETLDGAGVTWSPKDLEFASERSASWLDLAHARQVVGRRAHRRLEDFQRGPAARAPGGDCWDPKRNRDTRVHRSTVMETWAAHTTAARGRRGSAKHDVEVLTTCARDYVTWKNEY
jgi:hypothetical protein